MSLGVKIGMCMILLAFGACSKSKVPLNEKQFTSLLIDLHKTDGTLSVARSTAGLTEMKNYPYYNDVFAKYGITRAEFDSCLYYYSAQTRKFAKMYDVVVDSLNQQLTRTDLILRELKKNDSLNYFPVPDTLVFDSCYTHISLDIDSIMQGYYKFSAKIQFDTLDEGKNNRITAYFLTVPSDSTEIDTLWIRNLKVYPDTVVHTYNWSQYVDSTYDRLVIQFVDADNLKKLKYRKGKAWDVSLFRPYISRESEKRYKAALEREKLRKR